MRWFICAVAMLCLTVQAPAAPAGKFPYEAVVDADETFVRSGPGSKYYPTGKLRVGQRVMVHRHDPGSWHMIAPPTGSFSWIPAKYVNRTDTERGTVTQNNVAVRVGSFESDIRELFQRRLATGDEVRILGEKMLLSETVNTPAELWYRIEPPRGEWRWISGQAVTPAASATISSKPRGADPFESPDHPRDVATAPPVPKVDVDAPIAPDGHSKSTGHQYLDGEGKTARERSDGGLTERPLRREGKPSGVSSPKDARQTKKQEDADWDELDRLDSRLRAILNKEPLQWDFNELETDYHRLRDATSSDALRKTIDSRFTSIDRFRRERSAHEEQERFSQETLRRDAELQELQRRHEAQLTRLNSPKYDGAGIIERAAGNVPGAPRYVLLAPNGRVLAYLETSPGVNLDAWVGRPAGVVGSRSFRPDLRTDLIVVTRVAPVRLTP